MNVKGCREQLNVAAVGNMSAERAAFHPAPSRSIHLKEAARVIATCSCVGKADFQYGTSMRRVSNRSPSLCGRLQVEAASACGSIADT